MTPYYAPTKYPGTVEGGVSSLSLLKFFHIATRIQPLTRKVLLTAFSWHHWCLRNSEGEKRMSSTLTGLEDIEDLSIGVGKP